MLSYDHDQHKLDPNLNQSVFRTISGSSFDTSDACFDDESSFGTDGPKCQVSSPDSVTQMTAICDSIITLQSVERESATAGRPGRESRPMFRRGRKMYGIYLPSLSGRLDSPRLEAAYQKYSHRQRQKSVILVNMVDLLIKIAQLVMIVVLRDQLTLRYRLGHSHSKSKITSSLSP